MFLLISIRCTFSCLDLEEISPHSEKVYRLGNEWEMCTGLTREGIISTLVVVKQEPLDTFGGVFVLF